MKDQEIHYLAELSQAIRESTLNRLRAVPPELGDWRPAPDVMSFTDIAYNWLIEILAGKELPPIRGKAGNGRIGNMEGFGNLLHQLKLTGQRRFDLLKCISKEKLNTIHNDPRFDHPVTIWWTIVRGCLDHETHHRGQLSVYLRLNKIEVQE